MLTLGTISNLIVIARIWENVDELEINVMPFDTKDIYVLYYIYVFDISGVSSKQFPKNTKG